MGTKHVTSTKGFAFPHHGKSDSSRLSLKSPFKGPISLSSIHLSDRGCSCTLESTFAKTFQPCSTPVVMSSAPANKRISYAANPLYVETEGAAPAPAAEAEAATVSTRVAYAVEPTTIEVEAAAIAVEAAALAVAAATASSEVSPTQPSCNDPNHAEVCRMLMELFHYSHGKHRWMVADFCAGKHDIHDAMRTIRVLAVSLKKICLVAKQSDPSLEIVEGSESDNG